MSGGISWNHRCGRRHRHRRRCTGTRRGTGERGCHVIVPIEVADGSSIFSVYLSVVNKPYTKCFFTGGVSNVYRTSSIASDRGRGRGGRGLVMYSILFGHSRYGARQLHPASRDPKKMSHSEVVPRDFSIWPTRWEHVYTCITMQSLLCEN